MSRLLSSVVLITALAAAGSAEAAGTYFLVELNAGVGESAYEIGQPGLAYGVSGGTSFKLKALPLRWYLLGNLVARNSAATGFHEGIGQAVDRQDVDVYASMRTVLPVYRMVRVFAEAGMGQRFLTQTIRRSGGLETLEQRASRFLFIVALGAQARLSRSFSIGIRGEMNPIGNEPDLATFAADLIPVRNRLSLSALVGVHF